MQIHSFIHACIIQLTVGRSECKMGCQVLADTVGRIRVSRILRSPTVANHLIKSRCISSNNSTNVCMYVDLLFDYVPDLELCPLQRIWNHGLLHMCTFMFLFCIFCKLSYLDWIDCIDYRMQTLSWDFANALDMTIIILMSLQQNGRAVGEEAKDQMPLKNKHFTFDINKL